jgi:predicted nuclease with TOPRIM domain
MSKNDSKQPVNRGMLDEAVDTLLEGMDKLYERFKGDLDTRFDNVENRLRNMEVELSHFKGEIGGLKAELSDTPSRGEFEELKSSIKKHQSLS